MWKVRWKKWIKNCIEDVKIISLFRHTPASIPGILQEKLKDAGDKIPLLPLVLLLEELHLIMDRFLLVAVECAERFNHQLFCFGQPYGPFRCISQSQQIITAGIQFLCNQPDYFRRKFCAAGHIAV